MTGQQLNIAQRAASFVGQPRRARDKRSAAGMRRAALQANIFEGPVEPHNDAGGRHGAPALRGDDMVGASFHAA